MRRFEYVKRCCKYKENRMFETDMKRGRVRPVVSNGVRLFRDISLLFQAGVCYNENIKRNIRLGCGRIQLDFAIG